MTRLVTLVIFLAAMFWATEEIRVKRPRSNQTERLASKYSLSFLVGNFHHIVSDYYWLRSVEYFGRHEAHHDKYRLLGPLLDRSLQLDPHFFKPAYVSGTILNSGKEQLELSNRLLTKAMQYHPTRWELPFIAGFNAYMYQNEPNRALPLLKQAASLPGCPPRVQQIAAKLSIETAQPEIGLALIESMMETVEDPELLQTYEEKRRLLLLEVELKSLGQALQYFITEYERPPNSIDELLRVMGHNEPSDQDPIGGKYFIDADGKVRTTSETKRLRFSEEAKDQRK